MNESDLIDHKKIFFHICNHQNLNKGFCSSDIYKIYFKVCEDNKIKPRTTRNLRNYLVSFCKENNLEKFQTWNSNLNKKDCVIRREKNE